MSSPSTLSKVDSATVTTKHDENPTDAVENTLTLVLPNPTPSSPPKSPLQNKIPSFDSLSSYCVEEINSSNGQHNPQMVNIPEHENEHVERAALHTAALSDYNATGNFMDNSTIGLDMLAQFANPLNSLDMFNQVNGLSNLTYFPHYSLQDVVNIPASLDNLLEQDTSLVPSSVTQEPTRVSAYAKLIFEDGFFYMNTYSVILGRDLQAWHAAMREEKRKQKRTLDNGKQARDPKSSAHIKPEGSRYSRSIVSESGGILRTGDNSETEERARRRKLRKMGKASKKSKSTGSSAQNSRRNSVLQHGKFKVYEAQNLRSTISQADGSVPVDPDMLRPSPYDCPLVAIHPPASAPISAYKSISREHVKIAFNSRKSKFEAHVIGRNGCFVQDQWYHTNDVVPLESGDFLQVGGITVQFMLPNQLDPSTVLEYSDQSDESPAMDSSTKVIKGKSHRITEKTHSKSDEHSSEYGTLAEAHVGCRKSWDEDRNSDEMDEDDDRGGVEGMLINGTSNSPRSIPLGEDIEEGNTRGEHDSLNVDPRITLGLGKKRGPGRPPKNGILSKREQKLLKKEQQALLEEMVKDETRKFNDQKKVKGKEQDYTSQVGSKNKEETCTSPAGNPNDLLAELFPEEFLERSVESSNVQLAGLPTKNKVGRPRKHPLPDEPIGPPREKRKYTKRKPKEPKEMKLGETNASGSGEESKAKKEKIPPRLPRSPSPVMKEEDFTPEQLAKPQSNYVTLIHEALSNAPTQQLGLPDIYRAIYRKYPYFKFKTQTLGWQSSVRHNLSQHHAFRKVEKDGKGWTWGIVNGISIEKEKKKRATPPPPSQLGSVQHQYGYQAGQPQVMGHYPFGPSGYSLNQTPNPEYSPFSQQTQPYMQAPRPIGLPPSFIHTIPPQLAAPNVSTSYSSPYAPKPSGCESTTQPSNLNNITNSAPIPPVEGPEKSDPSPQVEPTHLKTNISQFQGALLRQTSPILKSDQKAIQTTTQPQEKDVPLLLISQGNTNQAQGNTVPQSPIPPVSQNQSVIENSQPNQSIIQKASVPPVNEDVMRAAETFKKTLLDSLKSKQSEIMVNSAINRVLGIVTQNDQPGNPQEDMIMTALRSLLSKIPGSNINAETPQ